MSSQVGFTSQSSFAYDRSYGTSKCSGVLDLDILELLQVLREDYRRFPEGQTYALYAPDVYFKDPLNEFRGVGRYRQMIGFIRAWFRHPRLELHHIEQQDRCIETRWTLSWNAPLPWEPRITITGRSELLLDDQGLIISHIDYWDCSPIAVLRQHLGRSKDQT